MLRKRFDIKYLAINVNVIAKKLERIENSVQRKQVYNLRWMFNGNSKWDYKCDIIFQRTSRRWSKNIFACGAITLAILSSLSSSFPPDLYTRLWNNAARSRVPDYARIDSPTLFKAHKRSSVRRNPRRADITSGHKKIRSAPLIDINTRVKSASDRPGIFRSRSKSPVMNSWFYRLAHNAITPHIDTRFN